MTTGLEFDRESNVLACTPDHVLVLTRKGFDYLSILVFDSLWFVQAEDPPISTDHQQMIDNIHKSEFFHFEDLSEFLDSVSLCRLGRKIFGESL